MIANDFTNFSVKKIAELAWIASKSAAARAVTSNTKNSRSLFCMDFFNLQLVIFIFID